MAEVVWTESALAELATLWLEADSVNRAAISAAQSQIDTLLAGSPFEVGESRASSRRVAFVPPLGIVFSIGSDGQMAKVLRVWSISRRTA
jgi:hypothetical protein